MNKTKFQTRRFRWVVLILMLTLSGLSIYASKNSETFRGEKRATESHKTANSTKATSASSAAQSRNLFALEDDADMGSAPEPMQAGGNYNIARSVIAGGGGSSSGGNNQVNGTIGQTATGVSAGGNFSLAGGFWAGGGGGCSYAINPTSQNFPAAGGSGSVTVTAGAGCAWTAASNNAWIVLASFSGTGNGSVGFMVAANTGAQRTGTATIAGQTFTVTQDTFGCSLITVNPVTVPNGFVGVAYPSQVFSASGGTPTYTFIVMSGSLPPGVTLAGNSLSGTPTTNGIYSFTIKATDNNGCTGTRSYTVVISGSGPNSLMFYPLASPTRLLDTRFGQTACSAPGAPIPGGTSLTQLARNFCGIPASAKAVTGNVTVVLPSANGFLTIYPSDAASQPTAANTNFAAGDVLNNVFTVGLGAADGAFKVFASTNAEVVIDITGYYAPPGAGGLYFHPLSKPIRLMETRVAQPGCFTPGAPLAANTDTTQQGTTTCDGVTIPATAKALVGNATTVLPSANGFITLYPADAVSRPLAASGNYRSASVLNSPFTVGLSPAGQFKIYTVAQTDLVIDVLGYFSGDATDINGTGLLFTPLTPARLLDTRTGASGACFLPSTPLTGGVETSQVARGVCTIANTAQAIVGNATTVLPAANGFLTFWPSDAPTRPLAATSNFQAGRNFNRYYTAGLGADGAFKMYASQTTNLVVDVSGYFAP